MTAHQLTEATELADLLFEQAPDALIFADVSGAVRRWNPGAERVFGHAASEVLGGSLDIIIPERFRDAHWRGFKNALDTGVTKYAGRALTTRAVHKDGRVIYVALTFALVREAGGAVIGALAIGRDCTESYLSEKALREQVSDLQKENAAR